MVLCALPRSRYAEGADQDVWEMPDKRLQSMISHSIRLQHLRGQEVRIGG